MPYADPEKRIAKKREWMANRRAEIKRGKQFDPRFQPLDKPLLTVLSLGAGVQSSAMLLLVLNEQLHADAAIFADTGWEPPAVYEHLTRLENLALQHAFPIYRVSKGRLRTRAGATYMPWFVRNEEGRVGLTTRQCTYSYKIVPIRRQIRKLLEPRLENPRAIPRPNSVRQLLGISMDEIGRVRRPRQGDPTHITNAYPLIDRRWTREDCQRYLQQYGITAPRSACIGCPFHSDYDWAILKRDHPVDFADAVQFEEECQRDGLNLDSLPFLHRSAVPLRHAEFRAAGGLFDTECAGVCGV